MQILPGMIDHDEMDAFVGICHLARHFPQNQKMI